MSDFQLTGRGREHFSWDWKAISVRLQAYNRKYSRVFFRKIINMLYKDISWTYTPFGPHPQGKGAHMAKKSEANPTLGFTEPLAPH